MKASHPPIPFDPQDLVALELLSALEGARFVVLSLLGVAQVYGLAFGLVARVEQLFWAGVGFLAYGVYTRYVSPKTVHRAVETSPSS
jgi:hypothetical protein